MVGERSNDSEADAVRRGGVVGSENAGMSSVKADETSAHRKSKVFHTTSIGVELVGPKLDPFGIERWITGEYSRTEDSSLLIKGGQSGVRLVRPTNMPNLSV